MSDGTCKAIYVMSTDSYSGKSALCVGLMMRMRQDGFKIGYMKPISTLERMSRAGAFDEDAAFMKSTFDLPESLETINPIALDQRAVESVLVGKEQPDYAELLKATCKKLNEGRDAILVEGAVSLREGYIINMSPPVISDLLPGSSLTISRYSNDMQIVDDLLTAEYRLGDLLLGGVINAVPWPRLEFVQSIIKPFLEKRGMPILGVLPRERLLLSASAGELAEGLGGEVLCREDKLDELVEHVLVGAMSADVALTYFRRKPHKAVITGGDRPDVQLAALDTSTTCLILTGNLHPTPHVLGRAEEQGVPIILTKCDTLTTVEAVEDTFSKGRFHQKKKVERFAEMINERFDFRTLYESMDLKK
jgi:BioD-like phosphotransacetylase family protein